MRNTTSDALALREFTKVQTASVKRVLKEVVGLQPELIRQAIIDGLLAPPPRSFPYLALAAAYLDGKPVPADPPFVPQADLSGLTSEQLLQRAVAIATRLQAALQEGSTPSNVIDITPTSVSSGPEEI